MGPETRLQSWLILAVMAAAVIAGGWKLFGDPATVWQWIGRGDPR